MYGLLFARGGGIRKRVANVPAYDLSWNLPAIHWIANFSNRRTAEHMHKENRIFAIRATALVLLSPGLTWRFWMRGCQETQSAMDHAKKAIYL
jgi:hypothetical protein